MERTPNYHEMQKLLIVMIDNAADANIDDEKDNVIMIHDAGTPPTAAKDGHLNFN